MGAVRQSRDLRTPLLPDGPSALLCSYIPSTRRGSCILMHLSPVLSRSWSLAPSLRFQNLQSLRFSSHGSHATRMLSTLNLTLCFGLRCNFCQSIGIQRGFNTRSVSLWAIVSIRPPSGHAVCNCDVFVRWLEKHWFSVLHDLCTQSRPNSSNLLLRPKRSQSNIHQTTFETSEWVARTVF